MLIEITANQAKVLQLLVECMTVDRFPDAEPDDFHDAWEVHRLVEYTPTWRQRLAEAWRHVMRIDSG